DRAAGGGCHVPSRPSLADPLIPDEMVEYTETGSSARKFTHSREAGEGEAALEDSLAPGEHDVDAEGAHRAHLGRAFVLGGQVERTGCLLRGAPPVPGGESPACGRMRREMQPAVLREIAPAGARTGDPARTARDLSVA